LDGTSIWLALALVLILEGLLPFASPAVWRRVFEELLRMKNGQIRFFALCSMSSGALLLYWLL